MQKRNGAGIGIEKAEHRRDGGLLQAEAVLNAEKTKVHQHNLPQRHRDARVDFHVKLLIVFCFECRVGNGFLLKMKYKPILLRLLRNRIAPRQSALHFARIAAGGLAALD